MDQNHLQHQRQGRPRRRYAMTLFGTAAAAATFVASCTASERTPLYVADDTIGNDGGSVGFTNVPERDAADEAAPFRAYCPSNKCPEGHTTCPDSEFRCDVDLKTNRNNCGACGSKCPTATSTEGFECIEGRCVLQCDNTVAMDCDGLVDNGCEISASNPNNCGACGNVCGDPAKPCISQGIGAGYACGCPIDQLTCITPYNYCVEKPKIDDRDCGQCGNACDPTGPGKPPFANAYYGCVEGQCGTLKCKNDFGDCDGDRANGCETPLTTSDDCGFCGNNCPANQQCRRNQSGRYECLCPAGQVFCGNFCADLSTDPKNCGSCGFKCFNDLLRPELSYGICAYGTCQLKCYEGHADCNANPDDSCEVNTNNDPKNCGGCGIVCDAIAGQACVGGRCVVEPCEQPDGGPVTR